VPSACTISEPGHVTRQTYCPKRRAQIGRTCALPLPKIFDQLHDVVGDRRNRPLTIDEVVKHVVGAVSDHRLFVLEPLDIRPSFFGVPHGVPSSEFRF
jgi:hypothetical protein